jgi:hypothetical protein
MGVSRNRRRAKAREQAALAAAMAAREAVLDRLQWKADRGHLRPSP